MSDVWDRLKGSIADAIDQAVEREGFAVNDMTIEYDDDDGIDIYVDLVVDDEDE